MAPIIGCVDLVKSDQASTFNFVVFSLLADLGLCGWNKKSFGRFRPDSGNFSFNQTSELEVERAYFFRARARAELELLSVEP